MLWCHNHIISLKIRNKSGTFNEIINFKWDLNNDDSPKIGFTFVARGVYSAASPVV